MALFDDFAGGLLNLGFDSIRQGWASDEATAARDWSAGQAQATRDFQERMRSTQYQTAVTDMKAAGLNPMLAYSQGGAGNLSGATAQGAPQAGAVSPSSYYSATSQKQNELLSAEADKAAADAAEARARTPTYEVSIAKMRQDISESINRIDKIREEVKLTAQQTATSGAQAQLHQASIARINAELPNLRQTLKLLQAQTTQTGVITGLTDEQTKEVRQRIRENLPEIQRLHTQLQNEILRLSLPEAQSRADARNTLAGDILTRFGTLLREVLPSGGLLLGIGTGGGKESTTAERKRWNNPPKGN